MPPYRARLGGAFGGGAATGQGGPQIDVASIIDAIIGGKASLTNQSILREKAKRDSDAQAHQIANSDAELALRRAADARETENSREDRKLKIAEAMSKGYDPTTNTVDPEKSIEVQKERSKRTRVVKAYTDAGLKPAQAAAAAENPGLAAYMMGFHEHESGDGESPEQKRASKSLAAVNTQTDNAQAQLNRTPLPTRPRDPADPSLPMRDPDPNSRAAQRNPAGYRADSTAIAKFRDDSTRVAGKRQQLETKLDSLGAVADTLSAKVQGRKLGPSSDAHELTRTTRTIPKGAPANPAQADYDSAAANFRAGPQTPERKALYDRVVAAIAKKHGQVK